MTATGTELQRSQKPRLALARAKPSSNKWCTKLIFVSTIVLVNGGLLAVARASGRGQEQTSENVSFGEVQAQVHPREPSTTRRPNRAHQCPLRVSLRRR